MLISWGEEVPPAMFVETVDAPGLEIRKLTGMYLHAEYLPYFISLSRYMHVRYLPACSGIQTHYVIDNS